jgi:hypothetical protein
MKVILTTYLTRKGDPQRSEVQPNDPEKMKLWYPACDVGVVFHDELSDQFINIYSKTEFICIPSYPYSCNDGRFVIFLEYLKKSPDVKEVWMTDLFDVKINYLPKVSNELFVSNEGWTWSMDTNWMQEKHRLFDTKSLQGKIIYNPGIWGGHRDIVIPILEEITEQFRVLRVGQKNANMVVFNKIIHKYKGKIETGYPLHTEFKQYQHDGTAAFEHK